MLSARIFALLAAIALMLPSGAVARPHYFCKMMERVLSDACCAEAPEHGSPREAEVRGPDCCERVVMPARAGSSSANDVAVDVPVAGLVALLSPYELVREPASLVRSAEQLARGPPGAGPPLFIAHCALLN